MNTTGKYISELLYRYECVILPGFGAFLTKRQAAVIQESTHAFFPPQKLISFNSQLQNNDGLLANYIATAEKISYTDAVAKIQRYVLSLRDKMKLGKRVELDGIGSFFTSVEDTLQFEAIQDTNYLTEAFGLHSFISPSIVREKEKIAKKMVLPQVARETYKEQVEAIEETTPIAFTPEKRRERPYLKYAAIAILAIGIAGFIGLQEFNSRTNLYNGGVSIKADKEIDTKIQQATFEISSPLPAINLNTIRIGENPIENSANTVSSGKYHIVAGAYRIKTNATKKALKLQDKGFNARLISVNKYGLHQVVYSSHENKLEALKALRNIKKEQNTRAWLLIKDL